MGKTRKSKKRYSPAGPSQCHPAVGEKRPESGCLPVAELQKAASILGVDTTQVPPAQLRRKLEQELGVPAESEQSFVNALPFSEAEKARLRQNFLRPPQPEEWKKDPDLWLDNFNIEEVMKQYEQIFPSFEFMGPYPIDFAAPDPYNKNKNECLVKEVCSLRIQDSIAKGIQHIGIVYNLDPHYRDGSHWVACFINIPKHRCFYFDSYGYAPPKQISKFMKWLTTQDTKMKLAYNARRFQFSDSECGMYCLYFIIRMLAGDAFRPFCRKAPTDQFMLQLRSKLFSV